MYTVKRPKKSFDRKIIAQF